MRYDAFAQRQRLAELMAEHMTAGLVGLRYNTLERGIFRLAQATGQRTSDVRADLEADAERILEADGVAAE